MTDRRLFVYGTLMPGQERWPLIADLVEDAEPTRTAGRLIATPHGWPAATFDGDGTVHGHLLRPYDGAWDELVERCDRIEGAGELFRRVLVTVHGPGGPVDATAYAWLGPEPPPGEEVPDGRWAP